MLSFLSVYWALGSIGWRLVLISVARNGSSDGPRTLSRSFSESDRAYIQMQELTQLGERISTPTREYNCDQSWSKIWSKDIQTKGATAIQQNIDLHYKVARFNVFVPSNFNLRMKFQLSSLLWSIIFLSFLLLRIRYIMQELCHPTIPFYVTINRRLTHYFCFVLFWCYKSFSSFFASVGSASDTQSRGTVQGRLSSSLPSNSWLDSKENFQNHNKVKAEAEACVVEERILLLKVCSSYILRSYFRKWSCENSYSMGGLIFGTTFLTGVQKKMVCSQVISLIENNTSHLGFIACWIKGSRIGNRYLRDFFSSFIRVISSQNLSCFGINSQKVFCFFYNSKCKNKRYKTKMSQGKTANR